MPAFDMPLANRSGVPAALSVLHDFDIEPGPIKASRELEAWESWLTNFNFDFVGSPSVKFSPKLPLSSGWPKTFSQAG